MTVAMTKENTNGRGGLNEKWMRHTLILSTLFSQISLKIQQTQETTGENIIINGISSEFNTFSKLKGLFCVYFNCLRRANLMELNLTGLGVILYEK